MRQTLIQAIGLANWTFTAWIINKQHFFSGFFFWGGSFLKIYAIINRLHLFQWGRISQELGNLAELHVLSLSNNFLTGTIPSAIFNLSSSIGIDFANNTLTGSLPDDMCQHLPRLQALDITNNHVTGPVPRNLWQCQELIAISLSHNQLTGLIPRDIGNLTSARALLLGNNNLIGTHILNKYPTFNWIVGSSSRN